MKIKRIKEQNKEIRTTGASHRIQLELDDLNKLAK